MTASPTTSTASSAAQQVRPSWAPTLLAAAAMFALVDIMRILLPSISFIWGRAGSTPAGELGLFALLLFVTAALAARACGVNSTVSTPIALAGTVASRAVLGTTQGGNIQLLAACLGFISVAALLAALAASDLPARETARGLALGMLATVTVHSMLGTNDGLWLGGAISWLLTGAVVVALVAGWRLSMPTRGRPDVRTTIPWLLIGPIIAFHGIAASTPAAIREALGESSVLAPTILVASSAAGYLAGRYFTGLATRQFGGVLVLVPSALTAVLLLGGDQPATAAVGTILSAFVATLTLTVVGESNDDSLASRGRRSGAVGGGLMLAFVILFGYYGSYELALGFPRGLLPGAGAAMLGVLLLRLETTDRDDPPPTLEDVATVAFAPFVVLFVLLAAQPRVVPVPFDASLAEVRVMTWNLHMGFDEDGRFDPDLITAVIASQQPDILVLNEVDRGWLLSGGHDLLGILTDELGMHYAFGPAADAIWGNAILSRHPITSTENIRLVGDTPMERSALVARIAIGSQELGVVATHLHHTDDGGEIRAAQAAQIAEIAQDLQLRSVPVVIAGDFNAPIGSDDLEALRGFNDLVGEAAGGAPVPTWPSRNPVQAIDHILASNGLVPSRLSIPQTTASDHLPVAVTISAGPPPDPAG